MAVANRFCRTSGLNDKILPMALVSDEALLLSGRLSSKTEAIKSSRKRASLIYLITRPYITSAGYHQAVSQLLYPGIACTTGASETRSEMMVLDIA
jgi:hypothetical protein